MKVILIEDVEKLGVQGQIVDVKPGYARNYLIPKGLAWLCNESNLKKLEHQKKLWEVKNIKEKEKAQVLKEKIEGVYYLTYFSSPPDFIKRISTKLNQMEGVLRHHIERIDLVYKKYGMPIPGLVKKEGENVSN